MDQTEKLIRLEKIKIFLMGVIITLAFLFLIGSGPSVQDIGRYQITATSLTFASTALDICIRCPAIPPAV